MNPQPQPVPPATATSPTPSAPPFSGAAAERLRYIEAPAPFVPDGPSIYLFGRTAGCPDWQLEAVRLLAQLGWTGTVLNPRPSLNPRVNPFEVWQPFGWQERNIRRCDVVLFWNPIGHVRVQNCYEDGLFTPHGGAVVVGCDPADPVQRANRVLLLNAMPWLPVHDTLADTVTAALAALDAAPARG